MPTVAGFRIENITGSQALNKGYLTGGEYLSHVNWVRAKFEERKNITFVYINGVYKGMATKRTKIVDIIEKFNK